jgi:hypothetical protein
MRRVSKEAKKDLIMKSVFVMVIFYGEGWSIDLGIEKEIVGEERGDEM